MNRSITRFVFPGSQGVELAGRLDRPPNPHRAVALMAHCFTCGKDLAAVSRIAAGLVAEGFAVLRFDFTGLGSSEGEFANTDFTSNVGDLVAAADALRADLEAPRLLVGHSLGGAAALVAASRIPEVSAVATIGAPADPAHVTGLLDADALHRIATEGAAEVQLAGRPFTIRREFLDDVSGQRLTEAVGRLRTALLVLHSPVDELVAVEHARRIFEAARHPKSFVSLDRADHLLSERADADYVARVLSAWSSRFLPDPTEVQGSPPPEGHVVVEETGTGPFTQQVYAGNHSFLADEPPGVGDDTGPSPYDLLLASLGTCTSMTIRMYARRRGLPLDRVRVTLTHRRHHAEDSGDPDGRPQAITVIERRIELIGELDDDQRAKLAEIAGKCPVHRTLEGDIQVQTSVVPR